MIKRSLSEFFKSASGYFPIIYVNGPRQSGKTTLIKECFSQLPYVSLEDPDQLQFALSDPKGLIENYPQGCIFDEAQRVPELFSYLQNIVDTHPNRLYVLSGSQNFLLSKQISQSLAGRVLITSLLPLSMVELGNHGLIYPSFEEAAYHGFYPRIFDKSIPPHLFYPSYVRTYVERDLRMIMNIGDLSGFSVFMKLCAGRVGQLLNLSSLAHDAGISVNTVKSWISVLESSYVVYRLVPHHKNFNKRLVKMPKLYFYDTGLLCYLLGLQSPDELRIHYAKGGVFENMIISELIKRYLHSGKTPGFYFWKDHKGKEVDLLVEKGKDLIPVEFKSGSTIHHDSFNGLDYWSKLSGAKGEKSVLIYGGDQSQHRSSGTVVPWSALYSNENPEGLLK